MHARRPSYSRRIHVRKSTRASALVPVETSRQSILISVSPNIIDMRSSLLRRGVVDELRESLIRNVAHLDTPFSSMKRTSRLLLL